MGIAWLFLLEKHSVCQRATSLPSLKNIRLSQRQLQGHCTQHGAGFSCSKPCEYFPWWLRSHDTEIYFYYLWNRVLWKILLGINDTFNNCSSSLQSRFSKRLYYFLAQAVKLAPDKPCNSPAPTSGSPPDPSLSSGRACPGRLHVLGQGCFHLLPVTAHFTHPSLTHD